jgi:hypothetical protein
MAEWLVEHCVLMSSFSERAPEMPEEKRNFLKSSATNRSYETGPVKIKFGCEVFRALPLYLCRRETSSLVLNIVVKTLSLRATTTSIVGERQFFLAPEGHTHTIPNGSLRRKPVAQTVSSPKRNFRGGCESGLRAEAPEALPRSAQDLSPYTRR